MDELYFNESYAKSLRTIYHFNFYSHKNNLEYDKKTIPSTYNFDNTNVIISKILYYNMSKFIVYSYFEIMNNGVCCYLPDTNEYYISKDGEHIELVDDNLSHLLSNGKIPLNHRYEFLKDEDQIAMIMKNNY